MIFALSEFHAFVISCEVKLQSEEILRNPNMYWILGISLTWEYTPVPSSSYLGLFCLRVSSLRRIFHSSSPEFLSFRDVLFFVLPFLSLSSDSHFFLPLKDVKDVTKTPMTPTHSDPRGETPRISVIDAGRKKRLISEGDEVIEEAVIGLEEAKLRRPSFGVMVWILFATSHPYSTDPHQGL